MLTDALFLPHGNARMKAAALPLSILIHGALLLFLVVAPLFEEGKGPEIELRSVFLAPPPPETPPAPPNAGRGNPLAGKRIKRIRTAAVMRPGILMAPIDIPKNISGEPFGGYGVDGGVPGGVDFGDDHPFWRSLVGEMLYQVVGDDQAPVKAAGNVEPPKLIRKVDPAYPEIARQARIEGIVVLEATTDIYGHVQRIHVLRSIPLLDQAAIAAVRQWLYEPLIVNGRPRPVSFTVTIRFKLE